mmetsp:Transcript_8224/g.21205  ORF Transcript_8224/g.21205 Transcript_8224/m.21205 type:complete len:226 (-) Transcript_8224:298-975(-)
MTWSSVRVHGAVFCAERWPDGSSASSSPSSPPPQLGGSLASSSCVSSCGGNGEPRSPELRGRPQPRWSVPSAPSENARRPPPSSGAPGGRLSGPFLCGGDARCSSPSTPYGSPSSSIERSIAFESVLSTECTDDERYGPMPIASALACGAPCRIGCDPLGGRIVPAADVPPTVGGESGDACGAEADGSSWPPMPGGIPSTTAGRPRLPSMSCISDAIASFPSSVD